MKARHRGVEEGPVAPSPRLLALFRIYLHWYLRRHFHALRLAHAERCPQAFGPGKPLILYVNHPSWWDPLVGILVSNYLLPAADLYGPMDAVALAHYGIFRRMGVFPVEQGTRRGAVQFLRSSMEVLEHRKGVLWITPQGAFTDVRVRPVSFRSGLAALAARLPELTCLPLAFEYTFWDERLPEILVNVGEPFVLSAEGNGHTLEEAMAATMDELATLALTRNPAAFRTMVTGAAGVSGIYEAWHRLRAALAGRKYQAEHGSIRRP